MLIKITILGINILKFRIFLIALLLSSYFIYNSVGTIDENSI